MTCNIKQKTFRIFGLALALSMLGCAPIKQARDVTTSGFLRDYSALQEGQKGEALKI